MSTNFDRMFAELEQKINMSNEVRSLIIEKLKGAIAGEDVNLADMSSDARESFMSIARELNSTLNSRDGSHINLVKLRMQEKRDEQVAEGAALVTELMRRVKLTSGTPAGELADPKQAQDIIEGEFEERGLEIKESEMLSNEEVPA